MLVEPLGVGIQHNPEISGWFPFDQQKVDVLEILVDTIMGPLDSPYLLLPGAESFISNIAHKYQLLAHSNYGCEFGFEELEKTPAVRRHVPIARMLNTPWVADHCFYGDSSWVDIWSSPLQFSKAEVRRVGERARRLQDLYGVPLAHENAAYYIRCPGGEMSEAAFLTELVNYAGTCLLLDLHNIYTNSLNHPGFDVWEYINDIPLERVVEIHLAGGSWHDGLYHDWHDSRIPEPVWELLEAVLERSRPGAVILEFQGRAHHPDTRVMDATSDTAMILREVSKAQEIWDRVYGSQSRLTGRSS